MSERLVIFLIVLIVPLGQMAIDLYLPSMPAMAVSLNASKLFLQYTITTYILGVGFSQLWYGPLSDQFGRRRIIIVGVLIFLLATIGCLLVNKISLLLVFRFLQGIGMGCSFVITSAIMADIFKGQQLAKVSSYSSMAYSLTPIFAPVIGGYIQIYWGWRMNFILMTVYAGLLLLLLVLLLRETNKKYISGAARISKIFKNCWMMSKNKVFMGNITCMMLSYGFMIAFSIVGPFLLQDVLGLSPVKFGHYALIAGLLYFTGTAVNGQLLHFFRIPQLIFLGNVIMILSSVTLLILSLFGIFTAAIVIITTSIAFLGIGLIFPNCVANALFEFPEMIGAASAYMGSYVLIGCTLISIGVAHAHDFTQHPLAVVYLILSVLIFISLYFISTANRRLQNKVDELIV